MFKLSTRSLERLKGIDPRLQGIISRALQISRVDFGIPEYGGLRTALEQQILCDAGLSQCDGYMLKSMHQSGKAFDVYAYVDGKASWDPLHLTQVAAAILQAAAELGFPLEWGGNWKSWQDLPHFELKIT